jgi:hypothetical protein
MQSVRLATEGEFSADFPDTISLAYRDFANLVVPMAVLSEQALVLAGWLAKGARGGRPPAADSLPTS